MIFRAFPAFFYPFSSEIDYRKPGGRIGGNWRLSSRRCPQMLLTDTQIKAVRPEAKAKKYADKKGPNVDLFLSSLWTCFVVRY